MLGQAANFKIGNQKLVSLDSIALFGIIGLLAAIGAIMTHNFQTSEQNYLDNFSPTGSTNADKIPVQISFNATCLLPVECVDGYSYTLTINCTQRLVAHQSAVCGGDDPPANPIEQIFEFDTREDLNASLLEVLPLTAEQRAMGVDDWDQDTTFFVDGYLNNDDPTDFRFFGPPECTVWCENTTWMYRLCIAVAALCVGFSGLVFLYLYLGCILDRINPRRRLERLANLLLMRGEEPPKLDRVNTASKSESIRPDLKEY